MQLVESADGSVVVLALDPTKTHYFLLDAEQWSAVDIAGLGRLRDGSIILRRRAQTVTIIETAPGERDVRVEA